MITFVIDWIGELKRVSIMKPFLYPLESQKKLYIFSIDENNLINNIPERIKSILREKYNANCQIIFLGGPISKSTFKNRGYLGNTLDEIDRSVLNPLRDIDIIPSKNYLIIFDEHQQNAMACARERNDNNNLQWELDVWGMAETDTGYQFSQSDLIKLRENWCDINFSDIPDDRGISRLPQETRQNIEDQKKALINSLEEIFINKNKHFENLEKDSDVELSSKIREEIKDSFKDHLERICRQENLTPLDNYCPARELQRLLINYYSINGIHSADFVFFKIIDNKLINLIFILIALIENSRFLENSKNRMFIVDIKIDENEFSKVLLGYNYALQQTMNKIDSNLKEHELIAMEISESSNCSCNKVLEDQVPKGKQFGLFLKPSENNDFDTWHNELDEMINKRIREGRQKISESIHQIKSREGNKNNKKNIEDIDLEVELLRTIYDENRNILLSKPYINLPSNDFIQKTAEIAKKIKDFLDCRPSARQFLICTGISMAILLIPYLSTFKSSTHLAPLIIGVLIMICGYLLIAVISLLKIPKRLLPGSIQKIIENASSIMIEIRKNFDSQKAFLISLCKTKNARENYEKSREVQQRLGYEKMLWQYHKDHISRHSDISEKLISIFNASITDEQNHDTSKIHTLNIHIPFVQSPLYSPLLAYKEDSSNMCAVYMNNQKIASWHSSLIKGIKEILLTTDNTYMKNECYIRYYRNSKTNACFITNCKNCKDFILNQ